MSDMSIMTTPIINNNNNIQPSREQISMESTPLETSERMRADKAYSDMALINQNNSGVSRQMTPEVLGALLKDPNVTVNFIKNIAALKEIIGDISAQDMISAEELEQIFNEFTIKSENLAQEFLEQEQVSSAFKGNLFDSLRELMKENSDPRLQRAITNFLKAINNENSNPEILKTLSGNLSYLSNILISDKAMSEKLQTLAEKFASPDAEKNFSQLMNETKQLLNLITKNVPPDSKLTNLCSMIKYNLSKFNSNTDILSKSLKNIMQFIPEREQRNEFMQKLFENLSGFENRSFDSKTLDALFKFFQSNENDLQPAQQGGGETVKTLLNTENPVNPEKNEAEQTVESMETRAGLSLPIRDTEIIKEFEQAFRDMDVESENIDNLLSALKNSETAKEFVQVLRYTVQNADNFADEFLNSDSGNTVFKGEIFDQLRNLVKNSNDPDLQTAVKNLLKNIFIENSKPEIMQSLTEKLPDIEKLFSQDSNSLNQENALNEENAFSGLTKEIAEFIQSDKGKTEFIQKAEQFFAELKNENADADSEILNTIVKIFRNHVDDDGLMQLNDKSTGAAVYSMISEESPEAAGELEQAFEKLVAESETLANEFVSSEKASSVFKGELFDDLKQLIEESNDSELKKAVVNLLKAINIENNKPEILKSFSDVMTDISQKLMQDKSLSGEVHNLPEGNILGNALKEVLEFIPDEQSRAELLQKLYDGALVFKSEDNDSKALNTLVKILQKQADSENIMQMKGGNISGVIRSLLSSPGNFTPLLHFVIPPVDEGIFNAFGEMWINPDEEDKKINKDSESSSDSDERMMHMLLVFDIPDVGRFETELWVRGKKINMSLLCPPSLEKYTDELSTDLKNSINFSEYFFDEIKVGRLEKNRSLIEVFPVLPQKRNGINVRI